MSCDVTFAFIFRILTGKKLIICLVSGCYFAVIHLKSNHKDIFNLPFHQMEVELTVDQVISQGLVCNFCRNLSG